MSSKLCVHMSIIVWLLSLVYVNVLHFMLSFSSSVGFQVQARIPKNSSRKSGVPDFGERFLEDTVTLTRPPVSPETARVRRRIKAEVWKENSRLTWPVSASLALVLVKRRNSKPTRSTVLPNTDRVGLDASSSDFI